MPSGDNQPVVFTSRLGDKGWHCFPSKWPQLRTCGCLIEKSQVQQGHGSGSFQQLRLLTMPSFKVRQLQLASHGLPLVFITADEVHYGGFWV